MPSYSGRTRGGGRFRVTGCCLPIAVVLVSTAGAAPALLWRHARRR